MRGRQHATILVGHLGQPGRNPLAAGLTDLHIQRPAMTRANWRGCCGKLGAAPLCQLSDKTLATRSLCHFTAIHPPVGVCRQRAANLAQAIRVCGQIGLRQPLLAQ
jgi:hypothetical protein